MTERWTPMVLSLTMMILLCLASGCDEPTDDEVTLLTPRQAINHLPVTAAATPAPGAQFPEAKDYIRNEATMLVCVGDELEFSIWELHTENRTNTFHRPVASDGTIALPLLTDRLPAAGLTVGELTQAAIDAYAATTHLAEPRITLTISERTTDPIAVLGAVVAPGPFEGVEPELRLLDAIALAGGFNRAATPKYLYVFRRDPTAETGVRTILINIAALFDGDPHMNILIWPGDVVYAPAPDYGTFEIRGQVLKPGVYALQSREITLKMALCAAGQPHDNWPEYGTLTRVHADGKEQVVVFNVYKLFAGEEADIVIHDGDIIDATTPPNVDPAVDSPKRTPVLK